MEFTKGQRVEWNGRTGVVVSAAAIDSIRVTFDDDRVGELQTRSFATPSGNFTPGAMPHVDELRPA